jgi:SAM-dependent MidA family methyltransferase
VPWEPWRTATQRALYGPAGFYRRPEGPAGHFRTSPHVGPDLARALLVLLDDVDAALGHPQRLDLVDVGAGRGELLEQLRAQCAGGRFGGRLRLLGVDLADRPPGLPADVGWADAVPPGRTGLVVANEWLDNVPVDVVEVGPVGPRLLLVDPATGAERLGGPADADDAEWLQRWWPVTASAVGTRAEVGRPRDDAWAGLVGSVTSGLAVGIDYGHVAADRAAGRYPVGTLAGYRDGRPVRPVPDGSCDVTAHVALDSCAAAGAAAGAADSVLTTQRTALLALGVDGRLPDPALARCDPGGYATRLARSSRAAELLAPGSLGGFGWLAQSVGMELPERLAGLAPYQVSGTDS